MCVCECLLFVLIEFGLVSAAVLPSPPSPPPPMLLLLLLWPSLPRGLQFPHGVVRCFRAASKHTTILWINLCTFHAVCGGGGGGGLLNVVPIRQTGGNSIHQHSISVSRARCAHRPISERSDTPPIFCSTSKNIPLARVNGRMSDSRRN